MHKTLLLWGMFLLFHLIPESSYAQIPVGEWRAHISFDNIHAITSSESTIYAASQAGVQIYRKDDHSLQTLSRVNGLSGAQISTLFYSERFSTLFIGYNSGNIDLVKEEKVTNKPEILQQSYYEQRTIYDVCEFQDQILFATGFGIVSFDPSNETFGDTYAVKEGELLNVYELHVFNGFLYAATQGGIYYADINEPLEAASSWKQMDILPEFAEPFAELADYNGKLIASNSDESGTDEVYAIVPNSGFELITSGYSAVTDLVVLNGFLYIAGDERIEGYNGLWESVEIIENIAGSTITPLSLAADNDGLWIGDTRQGLIHRIAEGNYEPIRRNGPGSNQMFSAATADGILYITHGGYDANMNALGNPGEVYRFQDEQWDVFEATEVKDFTGLVKSPSGASGIYVGSWGSGLHEVSDMKDLQTYNASNSPLQADDTEGVKVEHLSPDRNENLWMANQETTHPIVVKTADGSWVKHEYTQLSNRRIGGLLTTENGQLWGFLPQIKSVFAIDDNDTPLQTSDDLVRVERPKDNNQNQYPYDEDDIYAIAEDQDGYVWIATEGGVVVETNPSGFFDEELFQPSRVIVTEGGNSRYLLKDVEVTDIEVDPGNRKWFATRRSGVFLFSEDGDQMLQHFTMQNSPLPSDEVRSISINENSGETFFITPQGMVSYRGTANQPSENFEDAYVFPNPVKPGYNGPITITGLIREANVKITDISGNLVYETISQGGQAIWNGKDLTGRKVSSGVYLVFITNEDGSKTHMEKILFIK